MEQMELNVNLGFLKVTDSFRARAAEHLADYVNLDRKVLVLTDDGVPKEYLDTVLAQCPNGSAEVVPMGGAPKSFPVFERARMLELNFGRRDLLIARWAAVLWATWAVLPQPAICAALTLFRFPPQRFPRSIRRSAARPPST